MNNATKNNWYSICDELQCSYEQVSNLVLSGCEGRIIKTPTEDVALEIITQSRPSVFGRGLCCRVSGLHGRFYSGSEFGAYYKRYGKTPPADQSGDAQEKLFEKIPHERGHEGAVLVIKSLLEFGPWLRTA